MFEFVVFILAISHRTHAVKRRFEMVIMALCLLSILSDYTIDFRYLKKKMQLKIILRDVFNGNKNYFLQISLRLGKFLSFCTFTDKCSIDDKSICNLYFTARQLTNFVLLLSYVILLNIALYQIIIILRIRIIVSN